MCTNFYATLPEIAGIIDEVMLSMEAHAFVYYSNNLDDAMVEPGNAAEALMPLMAFQVFLRTDPFTIEDTVRLRNNGIKEGCVVICLPKLMYDIWREAALLYGDEDRDSGVRSSLDLYKGLRKRVKKVANIKMKTSKGKYLPGLTCSETVANWYKAGIKLSCTSPEYGKYDEPMFDD